MSFLRQHITPQALATESVWRLLLRFSLPAILATSATSLFNLTDSIFIGKGVGPMAMAALGVVLPIMNIVSAFGAMIGVGAASLLSIRLGADDRPSADHVLNNVVLLNVVLAIFITTFGLLFMEPLLRMFGASDDVVVQGVVVKGSLDYAKSYLRILLVGNFITNMYLSLNELMRVSGYPRKSMMIMLAAVVLNVALDALFIFHFRWGIAGSAWATIAAQTAALIAELWHFSQKSNFIHFGLAPWRMQWGIVRSIFVIGQAQFLLHFCTSVMVYFVNRTLHLYGDLYIGTYSVINRVVMLFIMIVAGLNQGMQPIVGYNYGAKNFVRVRSALAQTAACAVAVMSLGCALCELFPWQIASLFTATDVGDVALRAQSADFAAIIVEAMRIVFVVFPLVGFQIVTSNFFQYVGKSHLSVLLSLTRQLLFLVPLLIVLPQWLGYRGVWMSMPIADGTASLLAAVVLFFFLRRMK